MGLPLNEQQLNAILISVDLTVVFAQRDVDLIILSTFQSSAHVKLMNYH